MDFLIPKIWEIFESFLRNISSSTNPEIVRSDYIPKDLPLGFLGQLLALRAFGVQPEVTASAEHGEFWLWLNSEGLLIIQEERLGIEANWLTCH